MYLIEAKIVPVSSYHNIVAFISSKKLNYIIKTMNYTNRYLYDTIILQKYKNE